MALTKSDLATSIQKNLNVTKYRSTELVDSPLQLIKSTLESREDVLISRFGKFSVKDTCNRRGRNPQTGNDLMLDARRVVVFQSSGVPDHIPDIRPSEIVRQFLRLCIFREILQKGQNKMAGTMVANEGLWLVLLGIFEKCQGYTPTLQKI